jgi:exopolyphosphatase / guanosine-5'-triphosphate,3'-diphosphate pyrophosphatase
MNAGLRASIDIGSNSVLLLIAEVKSNKLKEIIKRCEITSLGRELDKNLVFHEESMQSTFEVIQSYVEDCDKAGVSRESIIATATEASRVAQNAKIFFAEIEKNLGVKINIISSDAEAYFSTRGILYNGNFSSEVISIMDIGGASTELIKVNTKNYKILDSISMPVGSVRSAQWLSDGLFVQNLQKIFLDFRNEIDGFQMRELYCVAGTVTSLGNMHLQRKDFIEDDVHGLVLHAENVDSLFKRYSELTPEQFIEIFPFLQKRSQSIRGGLHLAYHLVHRLFAQQLTISTYGLRFGTILEGKVSKEHLYGR